MKLKPYVEAITSTKEAKDKDLAPARGEETKKSLELEVAQLDVKILQIEGRIAAAASEYPFPLPQTLQSLNELALAERSRKQIVDLIGQLFPA